MSLFVLIVHNWLLGRAMCYLLPMLQDLPSYVIMLSLLAISFERWRSLLSKAIVRVNMNLVLPLIWLVSTLMVLPYNAFISHFYLDVSSQSVSQLVSYHIRNRSNNFQKVPGKEIGNIYVNFFGIKSDILAAQ